MAELIETHSIRRLLADLPRDDSHLLHYVNKYQCADKFSLEIHNSDTDVIKTCDNQVIRLSNPPDDYAKCLRGHIDTVLS